ncbi:TPA: tetratricopeptide repeat protein, partial [Listeria innocua]|nr:tetratricopeptide repeat protein [Listeria innocua]HBM4174553.1 tetratricopeptide repeat protein [Listeria innocua]
HKEFQQNLTDLLLEKFGSINYKVDKSIEVDTHEKIRLTLSNYSIKNRYFEYPNALLSSKFQSDIYLLLKETHERTKVELAIKRKTKKEKNSDNNTKIAQSQKQSIFIPTNNLTLKERILLSKEPILDGLDEEITGNNYYKQGKYEEAEEWLLRSVKGESDNPRLYERLGILYRKQRRYKDEVDILKIGIRNVKFNSKLNERLANAIEINEKNKLKAKMNSEKNC